jgi:glycosyltransferase involved in cell wall biosynthesis
MAIDISIIVPCRGRADLLQECLASLMDQKTQFRYEVIVVYCQADFEVEAVVEENEIIRAIRSKDYLAAGAARNLGAAQALANILGFIDSDCIVDEYWVTYAVNTIQNGAVLCSGVIQDALPHHLISSADNRLQYVDFSIGRPYGIAPYFPAAHIAVTKEVFHQVGGFPPHTQGEDVIFTLQIANDYKERVIFNPEIIIKHYGRTDWKVFLHHQEDFGLARAKENIQLTNSMRWFAKYPLFGWVIFLRRVLYITLRVVQWNFFDFPRYIFQLPFLVFGLIYWVKGFYKGFRT